MLTTRPSSASVPRTAGKGARHGYSYAAEYRAWQTMRLRCTVPTNSRYADYGGRGIKVCERWLNSVEAFIADMGPKPSPKHELDRYPDNDGNYEPGNCRWATRSENDRNRRSNRMIECDGEALTLAAWAELSGVNAVTIADRIDRGWPAERAVFEPARAKAAKGHSKTYTQPCTDCGNPTHGTKCRTCENRSRPRSEGGRFV
jgi:hypothetical protein